MLRKTVGKFIFAVLFFIFANFETVVASDVGSKYITSKINNFIMTMPDLNQYQVKRSKYPVHYIYIQHSLVSLHMVCRKGAFDNYDTICCAGPHHVREIRAVEKKYGKKLLNMVMDA